MKRTMLAVVGALAVGVSAYWWWSPHLAARGIRAAAEAGDVDRLAEYVDFERLRASLKAQYRERVASSVGAQPGSGAGALATLIGGAIATSMIDRAVDDMVTQQSLRALIASGGPRRTGDDQSQRTSWAFERVSAGTMLAFPAQQADLSPQARDRFVFKRSGFADWRLVEVRLAGSN